LYNSLFFFAEPELALLIALVCFASRHKWAKWQLKKRVKGDSPGIDCCNTSWRCDNHPFCHCSFADYGEKLFARAGLACQEILQPVVWQSRLASLQFMVC